MFEELGDRLDKAISKIKGYGSITEDNISDVLREGVWSLVEKSIQTQTTRYPIDYMIYSKFLPSHLWMTKTHLGHLLSKSYIFHIVT